MAFDRHQSTLATFQHQASAKFSTGKDGGGAWPFCMPGGSVHKADSPYMLWSNGANDEPYGLNSRVQNGLISRKSTDLTDSDGETDLQGLVSNILDEAGSHNSNNGRDLLASNSIWSPKTTSDELQQCFQSESKNRHLANFCKNYASAATSNTLNTEDKDAFQQPKEPAMSQQWLFNIPKGDKDYLNYRPTKLPPGLPMPHNDNAYQAYIQQERHDSTTVNEKRGNKNYLNGFPELTKVFHPQSETTNPFIHSHYEDNNIHTSVKPSSNEQHVSQEPNQLVTGFQSFMASKYDGSLHGTFADIYRETQGRPGEDWSEDWKFTSSSMPTHISPAVQTQKEMVGVQMERNGVMRGERINCDGIQELYGISTQNTEHFQQPKMFSGSVSLNNHYQTKMTMQKQNNLLPLNLKNNQCLKQQDHLQSKIKSQMQKEKKRMSGTHGENHYTSHITNYSTKGGEKNQQNLNHFGIMQSQRFGGEKVRVSAKNAQQFMSRAYPVNDPKRHLSMNSSNYYSRSILSHGNPAPGVAIGNMMPATEFTNADVNDLMIQRGDPTYHGLNSAMKTSVVMDDVPMVELYFYLDECCEQLRFLEKERKKTEIILTKAIQGGKAISDSSTFLPKMPPNPTRIDHLIVNQMKEQGKVASVLHRMESVNSFLHNNIHTALKKHYMAICVTEARRKEEIAIMSQQQQHREYLEDYKDTLLMVMALKDLAACTRRLRTALWCALQFVLPKAVKSQDQATGTARSPSPYEGGSFKL